jgi:DNA-binding response OmpR family regulator
LAKILVIEDDTTFLDLLRVHLSSMGHEAQIAEDAAVGLRAIVNGPPDLILLDLRVPYLDGLELLEALRSDPATRHIPVIVLTGQGDDEMHAGALKLGVAEYLTKPVRRERLAKAIERHLGAPTTES